VRPPVLISSYFSLWPRLSAEAAGSFDSSPRSFMAPFNSCRQPQDDIQRIIHRSSYSRRRRQVANLFLSLLSRLSRDWKWKIHREGFAFDYDDRHFTRIRSFHGKAGRANVRFRSRGCSFRLTRKEYSHCRSEKVCSRTCDIFNELSIFFGHRHTSR